MIAGSFVYAQPDTKEQAVALYQEYANSFYYSGGSEIITMCRFGNIAPGAVIDLKKIPETNILCIRDDHLVIGSCVTLRAIKDSELFPLLGKICGRIADHTNQCRITIGGNMCGTIIYRETVQALLLTDAKVEIFGKNGLQLKSIHSVFNERMRLEPGEFVLRVYISKRYLKTPFNHVKKTSAEKIDYPLLSIAALSCPEGMRFAVSGLFAYPFRSKDLEGAFNNQSASKTQRLQDSLSCIPGPFIADYQGSAEYRRFVFKQTLAAMMEVTEG